MGCTTILVGKKASYDGSTMIARNDDSGSGHFTPKKFVVIHPEEQPKIYRSVISHVESRAAGCIRMRYTAVPNAVDGEGIWAASGVNEAERRHDSNGDDHLQSPCAWRRSAGGTISRRRTENEEVPGGIGEEDICIYCSSVYSQCQRGRETSGKPVGDSTAPMR